MRELRLSVLFVLLAREVRGEGLARLCLHLEHLVNVERLYRGARGGEGKEAECMKRKEEEEVKKRTEMYDGRMKRRKIW